MGRVALPLDPALLRRWIDAAVERLAGARAEIDRINVFPVADHDTGSNLLLTVRAAAAARLEGGSAAAASALATAAVRGARGNSGLILSQLFRGVAEELAADRTGPGPDADAAAPSTEDAVRPRGAADLLAGALRRAATLATGAVSVPRAGTALTVLEAAATAVAAAAGSVSGRLAGAAAVAAGAARDALGRPAGRPAELVRAGVVDAGGLGVVVVLDALVAAAGGEPGPVPPGSLGEPGPARRAGPAGWAPQPVYEVTYRLADPGPGALEALRERLGGLGDSIGIAGDGCGGVAVHVHTREAGPAVEAGLATGRPSGIRIEALPAERAGRDRAVLLMIESAGAGELARAAGGDVLVADPEPGAGDVLAAVRETGAAHVVVLPCAAHRRGIAETAAGHARDEGVEVLVVPTASVPQGLAALAVHDPARRASDDAVAMAEAAAGTRTGALRVAEAEALTWAGRCRPGEVLGISDGEVVLIAPDLAVGALWLAHRMLTPGGELVSVLLGAAAPAELGERLAEDLRRTHPEVDLVLHRGGQQDYPLVLGVE